MKKFLFIIALSQLLANLALSANPQPAESVSIETPQAGWRTGTRDNASFSQVVNYPASSVNSPENQSDTARIRGKIAGYPKESPSPAILVVNGVAMPLKIDEQGTFDRPYAFSTGSNSVEVRTALNKKGKRVQFFDRGQGLTPAKLRVVLSWDSDNTDLDLHVVTPDGAHAWYGERSLKNGGAIDVDVTTGYGPEIFASPTPLPGPYLVYVNYFGGGYYEDEYENSTAAQPLTTATITVISAEGSPGEKQQSFVVPMREPGELTLVKRFSYP
ncbi:MAG: YfaP family protein [Methylococcales bacterium]